MRIPLGVTLESRDGSVTKDAKVLNGVVEKHGDSTIVRKRPGLTDLGSVHSGTAQLLHVWNGVNTIQGDYLNRGTIATIVSGPSSQAISPTNAGLQFSAQETGSDAATPRLMFKNRTQAWVVNKSGTISSVSLPSGLGSSLYSVTSITRSVNTATVTLDATDAQIDVGDSVTIAGAGEVAYNGVQTVLTVVPYSQAPANNLALTITRSGTTATAVSATPHGLSSGSQTISGAAQSEYNGSFSVTVTDAYTFTYTVTVTTAPVTPATGTPTITRTNYTTNPSNSSTAADNIYRFTTSSSPWRVPAEGETITVVNGATKIPAGDYVAFNVTATTFDITALSATRPHTPSVSYHRVAFPAVSGITRSGTTATLTTGSAHNAKTGESIVIAGANQSQYNGTKTVTVTGSTTLTYTVTTTDSPETPATGLPVVETPGEVTPFSFTYAVAGNPATPASGTITAATNGGTVPGIPYINGYFNIMDTNGVIFSSGSDDPTSWSALDFITAQNENGAGKALAKSQNYLIAFKEWSTEFFYDSLNQTGSPFSPVDNGFTQVGCASGESVKSLEGGLVWLSQTKQLGRGVHRMAGLETSKVSTPDVDRILNADDLATVRAITLTIDGHSFYVLTLETSDITLAYDLTSNVWAEWSSYTQGSSKSVSSITYDSGVATVNFAAAHTLNDGDPVKLSGADQGEYTGIFQASVVDSDTITIQVSGSPATPATGTIVGYPFTESYFKFTHAANLNGANLMLHETDGHIYQMLPTFYRDAGIPVNFFMRTARLDGGGNNRKKMPEIQLIGDKTSDIAMARWSDDDCTTFSAYRVLDLSAGISRARRCGPFRRRTLEVRHIGNTNPRLEAVEAEIV